jgi:Sec7-like guanine-nucleotide exchange factor
MVEVLGDNKPINTELLEEYIALYEFRRLGLIECLRLFFKDFFLNGEGQQVNRVAETLTNKLFLLKEGEADQSQPLYRSWDEVHFYVISFLMLNTDLHNKQNQAKMKP